MGFGSFMLYNSDGTGRTDHTVTDCYDYLSICGANKSIATKHLSH